MFKRDRGLLAEIERGALDDKISLTTILRKCITLGAQARNTDLRGWAAKELNGYRNDDEIPEYRIIYAPLTINKVTMTHRITGQTISSIDLPDFAREYITDEVRFAQGVGDLEALVRNAHRRDESEVRLMPPGTPELIRLWNHELQSHSQAVTELYWAVNIARVEGVLDRIRTTLVRIVSEVRAVMPDDSDVPSHEAVDQAVYVVLKGGKRNQVNIAAATAKDSGSTATATTTGAADSASWWTKASTIWTIVGTLVAIIGAYLAYLQLTS